MASVPTVQAKEVVQLQQDGHMYLDVRTPEEFEAGHAPNAVNVPVMIRTAAGLEPNPEFVATVEAQFPQRDAKLVLACASGRRSTTACGLLHDAGYSQIKNFTGSWAAWTAEGMPVVKGK